MSRYSRACFCSSAVSLGDLLQIYWVSRSSRLIGPIGVAGMAAVLAGEGPAPWKTLIYKCKIGSLRFRKNSWYCQSPSVAACRGFYSLIYRVSADSQTSPQYDLQVVTCLLTQILAYEPH